MNKALLISRLRSIAEDSVILTDKGEYNPALSVSLMLKGIVSLILDLSEDEKL